MPANPQPMISVSDLAVSYGNYVAVKGISFDVRRGEHITIAEGEEVTPLFSPEHAVLLER